jgi:hypothetical protein
LSRPYLGLTPNSVYWLDGIGNDEEPDWHEIHVTLSRIHRFGGRSQLTVLQHAFATMTLSMMEPPETQRLAFLHDHHEALVGDVPTPIKRVVGKAFKAVERHAEEYVRRWFTLGGHDFVKAVDWRLCLAEAVAENIADFWTPWIMEAGYTREIHEQTMWALRVGNDVDRADVLVASWRCAYEDSRIIVTPDPKYSR